MMNHYPSILFYLFFVRRCYNQHLELFWAFQDAVMTITDTSFKY